MNGSGFSYGSALIVIASISAVMWTGGLIVLQLRQAQKAAMGMEMTSTPTGRSRVTRIKGATACVAFGMLVPLLALITETTYVRSAWAFGLGLLYLSMTGSHIVVIERGIRATGDGREQRESRAAARVAGLYFLPTLALLFVCTDPSDSKIAWTSAILAFLGYVNLSDSVYEMADS